MEQATSSKGTIIRNIYLYLVSFVALMMVIFSTADLINTTLRTYVFTKADINYYSSPVIGCDPTYKGTDPSVKPMTTEECAKIDERNKKQEEDNRAAQRQSDLVRDISMIVVGVPVFAFHWMIIRKKENS